MKTRTIALLLAFSTLPVAAQRTPRLPTAPPGTSRATQPKATRPASVSNSERHLSENLSIRLNGSMTTGQKVDLTLTGIGPVFRADQLYGDATNVLSCAYTLNKAGERYKLEYSVGMRVRITVSMNGGNPSYQYQDISISGSILCDLNKPVAISESESEKLTLTLSKPVESRTGDH